MTIDFKNRGHLVKTIAEIPSFFIGASKVYLDLETKSGYPDLDSLNPWRHCTIAGFSVTVDDCPDAYYVDHKYTEDFYTHGPQFLQDLLWYASMWVNHNIKYDMHVLRNCWQIQFPKWLQFKCTIVRAKLIHSDMGVHGGYTLDNLMLKWLNKDITPLEDNLKLYLGRNNKDFGRIPSDIIAEYGCEDVLSGRELEAFIESRLPERATFVAETELKVTRELFKLEQNGMHFDEQKMRAAQIFGLMEMNRLASFLEQETTFSFDPSQNQDCNEVLCGHYGLPIMLYTTDSKTGEDTDNASFNKAALAEYLAYPYAPHHVINAIVEYRDHNQRNNLFYKPLLDSGSWTGVLHPTYNQVIRTGRMSARDPNPQQFDEIIAGLVEPPDSDWAIISSDASQIEKRLVVHYIQDATAIDTWRGNPDADFYMLTANDCGISRSAAKTVDLGTGYGEGEKKLINQLKRNPDVIKAVKAEVAAMGIENEAERLRIYDELAGQRGKMIFKKYHGRYPTLKPTSKRAQAAVKENDRSTVWPGIDDKHLYGYITNLYGRDRHIPYAKYRTNYQEKDPFDRAFLAFPTLNQGTAADLMKERWVALMEAIDDRPILSIGLIHDELILIAPKEIAHDPRCCRDIVGILEAPAVEIDVPIRWSIAVSDLNWIDAATAVKDGGRSAPIQYNKADCENFTWLENKR